MTKVESIERDVARRRWVSYALAAVAATVLCGVHAARLSDTGQTQCYDGNGATISCTVASAADDGRYGRDAAAAAGALTKIGAGAAGFDFTKIANNGGVLPAGAALGTGPTNWACTRDNVTGLIWEVKTAGPTDLRFSGHSYTWYNPNGAENGGNAGSTGVEGTNVGTCNGTLPSNRCNTQAFVAAVNSTALCGYTDWRLPTPLELRTIVNYSAGISLDTTYFPNPHRASYWSASTYVEDPAVARGVASASPQDVISCVNASCAWVVTSLGVDDGGGGGHAHRKAGDENTRLVRGAPAASGAACTAGHPSANALASTPSADFIDHGDGTVTHARTGLMWKQCAEGLSGATCAAGAAIERTWSNALAAAESASFAGFTDWRLPNLKELQSIVETCGYRPALNQTMFPGTPAPAFGSAFWSASTYTPSPGNAWVFVFGNGGGVGTSKASLIFSRLVRAGQSFDAFDAQNAGAPIGVAGTRGNGQVSVAFTAPSSFGGAAITGYTVTASPGGATAMGTSSPIVVTGLTNGTSYTFTVTATNSAGVSATSSASAAVTPASVPGAPTSVVGTSGNAQVSVAFTASSSSGGAAITGYTVTASPGGATATGTASPLVVTGLTNGAAYTFTVTATNSVGTSAASAASASVTPGPTITGAPLTLAFSATKNGAAGAIVAVTSPQTVSVTFAGGSAPAWTATANQPWVAITSGTGTGTGTFAVAISDPTNIIAGSTSLTASITIASTSGPTRTSTVALTLTVVQSATSIAPFGSFDTPLANAAVAGSIAVTGWALDDVEVTRVEIWRDRVVGETTPLYPGPGPGTGKIYIADPVFVTGARPDVEAGYPTLPRANRAGWGYLLLTQGLWNQGNGPFTLYAFAYDREGRSTVLGSKAITVSNATATRPFGSIDVPAYGQTMTGSFYNFGWALTPNATPTCTVSTVQVSIDSGPLQPVSYGDARTDIAAAFPGFSNGAGAGGAYYIDIATLSNGSHQIGWYVVDSCGRAEGVGSRFFSVLVGSSTVALESRPTVTAADAVRVILDQPVIVRRDLEAVPVEATGDGDHLITIRQEERIEVELPATDGGPYVGYQIVNGMRRGLPAGSSLDGATGVFYWQPATGFLGTFDLEFVAATGGVTRVSAVVAPPQ